MKPKHSTNLVGRKIKLLRQKKHWTQGKVADQLEISVPAYSKIEAGLTDINISRLEQIAMIFEVPVVQIINGINNTNLQADLAPQIDMLNKLIAQRDQEIIKLQKKAIDLYEEARINLSAVTK